MQSTNQDITKFSNQLTMKGKVEEIANKIIAIAKELNLNSGIGPKGIATVASHIASVLTGEFPGKPKLTKYF